MLHDGDLFTAKIDGTYCAGEVGFFGEDYYLLQNKKDGSNCPDKRGYEFGWNVGIGTSTYLAENLVTELNIKSKVTSTSARAIPEGSEFTACICDMPASGIVTKQNGSYYLLQNVRAGADCPKKYGFNYSYNIKTGSDADLILTRVTSLEITAPKCKFKVGDRIKLTAAAQKPGYQYRYSGTSDITGILAKVTIVRDRQDDGSYEISVLFDKGQQYAMSDAEFDLATLGDTLCVLNTYDIFKYKDQTFIVLDKNSSHLKLWTEYCEIKNVYMADLAGILPIGKLDTFKFPLISVGSVLKQVRLVNMSSQLPGVSPFNESFKIKDGSFIRVTKLGKWQSFGNCDRYLPFQAMYNGRLYYCCLSSENRYEPAPSHYYIEQIVAGPGILSQVEFLDRIEMPSRVNHTNTSSTLEFKTQKRITI